MPPRDEHGKPRTESDEVEEQDIDMWANLRQRIWQEEQDRIEEKREDYEGMSLTKPEKEDAVLYGFLKEHSRTFTKELKLKYLQLMAKTNHITNSAKACGVTPSTIRSAKKSDTVFNAAVKIAHDVYIENIEAALNKMVNGGHRKMVVQQGSPIVDPRDPSKLLFEELVFPQIAMFMAKSHKPEVYRDATESEGLGGGVLLVPVQLSPTEWMEKNAKPEEELDTEPPEPPDDE